MSKKAYFVETETEELYELSATKRKQLEKKYPRWFEFNCDLDPDELTEVYDFFKEHGKLIGHPRFFNSFIGLTVD